VRSERRKHFAEARILNADGVVLASGCGLFFEAALEKKAEGGANAAL